MKPHIYLDVDGVLNACTSRTDPGWGWADSELVTVCGYPIHYSPSMVAMLNDLAEHATFHWLTTWRHDAPRYLAPAIGLNGETWPVLDGRGWAEGWWKLKALRLHLAQTRPERAFWIDDDIVLLRQPQAWLECHPTVVPVSPNIEVGLTRKQLTAIVGAVTGVLPA